MEIEKNTKCFLKNIHFFSPPIVSECNTTAVYTNPRSVTICKVIASNKHEHDVIHMLCVENVDLKINTYATCETQFTLIYKIPHRKKSF